MVYQISPGINTSEVDLTTVIPGVSTTTGAFAGVFNWGPVGEVTLISSEPNLVATFGKPNSNNPETWFTAKTFLDYSGSLQLVRTANTTDPANGTFTAVANVGTANVVLDTVRNSADYYNRNGSFEANALYLARYPGSLGNSLAVSVCDSVNAYSSNVSLLSSNSTVVITGSFNVSIGANTGSLVFAANTTVSDATIYATTVNNAITVGDFVKVGNSSIGTQFLQVTSVSQTANTTNAVVNLSFSNTYRLAQNYVANTTMNGNTSFVGMQRNWQYYNSFAGAPVNSQYVQKYGNNSVVDSMHIAVVDRGGLFSGTPGSVLEPFPNVSRAIDARLATGDSNYYATVINQGSNYIWFANDRSGAASANAASVTVSSNQTPLTLAFQGGTDGYTESTVPLYVVASGYDMFASKENISASMIMQGKPIGGSTSVNGQTVNNYQLANYIIDNIATQRLDCIACITPDDAVAKLNPGAEAAATVNWAGAIHYSSYAVMDSGYFYIYDKYNDLYRYVPSNGAVAGLMARTEQTNDAWWSPAGFNRGQIKNVVKLRWNPRKPDRDVLYQASINPIVTFSGEGTVLYGDKTLVSKPSAFDRINVRRLFIVLETAIAKAAQFELFEFNDDFTRSQFKNMVIPYLRDIQARRGITDFLVVCDGTNNTSQVVDTNNFVGDIYIKPNHSINFIQLNFVAVGSGVSFATIVGQF